MTQLAIECSGTAGSVALYAEGKQLGYADLAPALGSVQTLALEIQKLVRPSALPAFISITTGPGSFTGLRVGLATAKMLALAWHIPIVAVDTLQAVALRAVRHFTSPPAQTVFVPIINAYRKQVFSAAIQFTPEMSILAPSQVLDTVAWQASPLQALGAQIISVTPTFPQKSLVICGPGLSLMAPRELESAGFQVVSKAIWNPTAAEVAWLGWQQFQAGSTVDALSLQPLYLRASAAEEQAKR